jgi:hypothetical protein
MPNILYISAFANSIKLAMHMLVGISIVAVCVVYAILK